MYVPRHFELTDLRLVAGHMQSNSFATLVSFDDGNLTATHLPLLVDMTDDQITLTGHVARANPHWKAFASTATPESLAVFAGPHAYISPSWYAAGSAVPTWDYVTVHAYGRPALVTDEAERMEILERTVATYEAGRVPEWRTDSQDAAWLAGMARGKAAFRMSVTRWQAKTKLGQNRPADQAAVASALSMSGDQSEREVGQLVSQYNGAPMPE